MDDYAGNKIISMYEQLDAGARFIHFSHVIVTHFWIEPQIETI